MLLTIDVGNTQTVIGLYESSAATSEADTGLLDFWRIATDDDRTSDEHAVIIRDLVRSSGYKDEFDGIAICSGVPTATIYPPLRPPSGPRSITWSAVLMTSRLCSITITVLP